MEYDKMKALALSKKIVEANNELQDYLLQAFPQGARCLATLMRGQKYGTPETIIGVSATIYGGEVMVAIDTAKKYSRQRIRSIGAGKIELIPETVEGGAA